MLIAAGIVLLLAASLHDVAVRTIPNWMCLALGGIGLLLRVDDGALWHGLAAALLVLAAALACCARGWLGGGDAKLLAAGILLLPPHRVVAALFAVSLAGALLALVYVGLHVALRHLIPPPGARPAGLVARACRAERFRLRRGGPLPFGVGIAAGVIFGLLGGPA